MHKTLKLLALCSVVIVFSMGQTECQPEWPVPPFDTSGSYAGTWSGRTTEPDPEKAEDPEEVQVIEDCPLTMTLTQDVTADYPADHGVEGTVNIDYSCVQLPEWVEGDLPASNVNVTGLLADDGKLSLLSGGCGTGICVLLTLAGEGQDLDADGLMDTYSGAWSYIILLAGVQPFGVSGTFGVAVVAE